jgi:hypothetical protein
MVELAEKTRELTFRFLKSLALSIGLVIIFTQMLMLLISQSNKFGSPNEITTNARWR